VPHPRQPGVERPVDVKAALQLPDTQKWL
jgi:hypothetical protein